MGSVVIQSISPPSSSLTGEHELARLSYSTEGVAILAVVLAACGHLLIKHGLNTIAISAGASLLSRLVSYLLAPLVMLGLAVYGSGTLVWIVAVAKLDISYLFPITALNYAFVTLGGMWLLKEPVSIGRWGGILIVMLGVTLMQRSIRKGAK